MAQSNYMTTYTITSERDSTDSEERALRYELSMRESDGRSAGAARLRRYLDRGVIRVNGCGESHLQVQGLA